MMPIYQVEGVEEECGSEAEAEADQVTLADGMVEAVQLSLDYLD